jgi:pyruvate dehydrogenase E2 component (dihydrolipoamide acetyltransferase)
MNIFNLPDLGEGLPDAEINEWFVKVGDQVQVDQPLVAMETAKAVVDVPCPQSGTIAKLFGKQGDVIKTGEALVAFQSARVPENDKGTVVGSLEESDELVEDNFTIGTPSTSPRHVRATPAVKMLAKKLGIDIKKVTATGDHGLVTAQDVQAAAEKNHLLPTGFEALHGVRRAMLHSMVQSHQEVVPVSVYDEADINSWADDADITVRLIQAIVSGCAAEPSINAWFDTTHSARQCFAKVHLGIAMDNEDGLFVPVLHDAGSYSPTELRRLINEFKQSVTDRTVTVDKLKGATIILSNFGKFSGRFASPIIVPPMVAILAVGKLYPSVVATKDAAVEVHKVLPLSLTFDHRAVSGGEATRFLGAVISALEKER